MLDQLFGSKTRVKLLTLFLLNTDKQYFVRELERISGEQLNSIRRELEKLQKMGLIHSRLKQQKKYFETNQEFKYLKEFKNFVLKAGEVVQGRVKTALKPFPGVVLVVLSGVFTDVSHAPTDLLIVGTFSDQKMREKIKELEHGLGRELRYVVLDSAEYEYREQMGDQFILDVFNSDHILVIDKRKKKKTNV